MSARDGVVIGARLGISPQVVNDHLRRIRVLLDGQRILAERERGGA